MGAGNPAGVTIPMGVSGPAGVTVTVRAVARTAVRA